MGESWPRSCVQTERNLGRDSPIQTSCSVNKSWRINLLLFIPNSWLSPQFLFPSCYATNRAMMSKNRQAFPERHERFDRVTKNGILFPRLEIALVLSCLGAHSRRSITLTTTPLHFTFSFLLTAKHKAILPQALPLKLNEVFSYRAEESSPKVF